MFSSVLSVLLMGMLPVLGLPGPEGVTLRDLAIAAPSPYLAADPRMQLAIAGRLSASGVLVLDLESGQVVYARDSGTERPMASLTKLMTAILIVERHDLSAFVTVPKTPMPGGGEHLPLGQEFTVGDLLTALLVASDNDAAVALAIVDAGTTEAFVAAMNERAVPLGLKHTSFANPVGLDDPRQWSTPQDLAWLTRAALRYPEIAARLGKPGATIRSRQGQSVYLTHTHAFLHIEGSSVIAGKTGTTLGAGQCLMSVVAVGNRRYIVVLLKSLERYKDMQAILDALRSPTLL